MNVMNVMKRKNLALAVVGIGLLSLSSGVVTFGGQRFGRIRVGERGRAARAGDVLTPSQVWRVTSLTMDQRTQLSAIQSSTANRLRDMRTDSGGGDRRGMVDAIRELEQKMSGVLTSQQLSEARTNSREPLVPEELLYYPITSMHDIDAVRRAKLDAVFLPAIAQAKSEAGSSRGFGKRGRAGDGADPATQQKVEAERGEQRQRRLALFEVLDALMTTDQVVAVKQFIPEQVRNATMREQVVYRLPSLSLMQESQARAIFAALDDETAADRARLKAIGNEIQGDTGNRKALADERRQTAERVAAREKEAYASLQSVLTPDQMKELATQKPGPQRPVVFTPEAIRSLPDLTADQRRRIDDALRDFLRGTKDERAAAKDLNQQVKGGDIQSLEMADVRDQLRRAALVLDVERDRATHAIADTLTPSQIARLVSESSSKKIERPAKAPGVSGA